jgi:hypothetical protein
MSHIRSLSVERRVSCTETVAYATTITPKFDLFSDLSNAFSEMLYRKKFEPLPG